MIEIFDYFKKNNGELKVKKLFNLSQNIEAIKYSVGKIGESFAYIAYPNIGMPKGGFPAILLIHGGDGRAFSDWANLWAERGYVAIAPDFNSQEVNNGEIVKNSNGGPSGYGSILDYNTDNPWAYYSILSGKIAIDILCENKKVDKKRIYVQGISWGGFLSLSLCGVDNRPKALSVVYSSAFISNSQWGLDQGLKNLSKEQLLLYNENIDPQSYIRNIDCPVIFSAGTDDGAFMMKNRIETGNLLKKDVCYSLRNHYVHGHIEGWSEIEPYYFFENKLVKPICDIKGNILKVINDRDFNLLKLVYTNEDLFEKDICVWEEMDFNNEISIPSNATYFFVYSENKEGLKVSSKVFNNMRI